MRPRKSFASVSLFACVLALFVIGLGLFSAQRAEAAITVGYTSTANGNGTLNLSLTCNSGDLVLVMAYPGETPTVSGGTFALVPGGSAGSNKVYEMTASTSFSGATVSVPSTNYAILAVFSGTAGVDAVASKTGNPNTAPSVTVTTGAANEMVVAFSANAPYPPPLTAGSGFSMTAHIGEANCETSTSQSYASGTPVTAAFSTSAGPWNEVALTLKPAVPPAAPTGLTATPGSSQVDLAWTGSSGATSYNVYRGTASGAEALYQSGITSTSYADSAVTTGTTYYYEVTAVNSVGESGKSNEASAAPLPPSFTLSASPGSLTIQQGSSDQTTITASPVSGFTGSVDLSLVTPPSGISGNFNETSVSIGGDASSVLTLSPDNTVAPGNYTLTVQGVSGSITQSTSVTLTVTLAPPGAPTALTATPGNAQVALSWTAPANSTVASYSLYRATTSGGEGSTPVKTGITGTTYTDSGLTNGTTYYYEVTAANSAGESAKSNEANATPIAPPSAPTGLTATAGNAQVGLSWTAPANGPVASYNLYRGTTPGGEGSTPVQTGITGTTYTDTGLTNGTTYYYEATAVNASGESGMSNEASGTPTPPPAAPANLTATAGNAQVMLSWTASSGAASYNIYRGTSPGGEGSTAYQTSITSTSYTDTGVTNGTTYYYKVTAVNTAGEGPPSNEASATPAAPVFTTISVSPSSATVGISTSQQFTASALDQYGNSLSPQPQFTWSLGSNSVGSIDQTGLFSSGSQIGTATVIAQSGALSGTASVLIALVPPDPPSGGDSPEAGQTVSTHGLRPNDSPTITIPDGLQMISVPYSYSAGTPLGSSSNQTGVFNVSNPVLAYWVPAQTQYVVTPTAPANEVQPGYGYWSNFPQTATVTPGTAANEQQSYEITLNPGWNMIGDPFLSSVALNACTFATTSNELSCQQAVSSGLINGLFYTYSNSAGEYVPIATTSATVNVGVGYWIYVAGSENVTMVFPGPWAPPSIPTSSPPTANPNSVFAYGEPSTTLSVGATDASGGTDLLYTRGLFAGIDHLDRKLSHRNAIDLKHDKVIPERVEPHNKFLPHHH